MEIGRQLATIAAALRDEPENARIIVCREGREFSIVTQRKGKPSSVAIHGQGGAERATRGYFEQIFGTKRVAQVLGDRQALCKRDVAKLFASVAEVTVGDIQELVDELRDGSRKTVRYLDETATETYRSLVGAEGAATAMDPAVIEALARVAAPFKQVSHALLHEKVEVRSGGDALHEQRVRVLLYDLLGKHGRESHTWLLAMAKGLNGRAPPEGALIPHKDGYLYNFARIEGGGASKAFLKALGGVSAGCGSLVLYRGTKIPNGMRDWSAWETVADDVRQRMGTWGSETTARDTEALLTDVAKGFVMSPKEQVTFMGMSLGGVHAQRDALRFANVWDRLITVASPGLDKESVERFAGIEKESPGRIDHYIEADDVIDEFGDAHLGASPHRRVAVETHIVHTMGKERPKQPTLLGAIQYAGQAIRAHVRQTYLSPFKIETMATATKPHNPIWEAWRQRVAFNA